MANLFQESIKYITTTTLQDSSSLAWLLALTNLNQELLIRKAEIAIDEVIWFVWKKELDTQITKFPIENTWSIIPINIQKATVLFTECIYNSINASTVVTSWNVKTETYRSHKIEYFEWNTSRTSATWTNYTAIHECLTQESYELLKWYMTVMKWWAFFRS